MANQITYTNKETFQTSPLPEVNKATSANYNEIKDTVNANADEQNTIVPESLPLTDGAAIPFDWSSKFFRIRPLLTVEAAITLTLSNVVAGANQILSVKKDIAGDVTITLAGAGLTFYGYNDADLNTVPDIILSGASGDVFDISFLARTATEIGVITGEKGN